MVGISTKGIYAIAAMHTLHHARGKRMQIKEISAMTHISHGYLEQILSSLKKSSLVISSRGVNGGYKLAREAQNITALEVIEALEGELFTPNEHSGASIVLDSFWGDMQTKVRDVFNVKLSDLDNAYQTFFYEI